MPFKRQDHRRLAKEDSLGEYTHTGKRARSHYTSTSYGQTTDWGNAVVQRDAGVTPEVASSGAASETAARSAAIRVLPRSWFAKQPARPQARPVDWGSAGDRQSVTRALHRQGQLWRAILSGENCLDFLSTDDYLGAADQLLGHIRHLTLRFLRRFWITTTATAAILAAAITTVFLVHATSAVLAALVTGAGAIGITWKGAASSLGRVLTQVQRPLWESELDAALANAVTWMPRERRSADRPAEPDGTDEEPAVAAVNPDEPQG